MRSKVFHRIFGLAIFAAPLLSVGCGGGSASSNSGTTQTPAVQTGNVNMMVSDAPANDWATIGVKVLSITLNPQGGGTPVTVFTAPSTVPMINLVQLDQLGELIGNASVPAGTYTSATLTLSANQGDVTLISSDDPDPGFAWTANTPVPSAQIQIQGTTGNSGSLTVPLTVNFVSNLVVTANQTNQLDLEFDLSHPAFVIAHVPSMASTAQTLFAINFNGPWVHHHPIYDITHFLLRDLYGTVGTISSDGSSMTVTKDYPVEPPTSPETEITSSQTVTIKADTNSNVGMLFYNLDVSPVAPQTIFNFSTVASTLTAGKYVRIASRYQADGLYAVRVWVSSSFDKIWQNPEGHVLHVNTTTNVISVETEAANPKSALEVKGTSHVDLQVTSATQFYFRAPAADTSDSKAIGTGTAFLSNVKRGFKVHVLADPTTSPLPTAVTVDIEIARFDGEITNASSLTTGSFDYTRIFNTSSDNYTNFPLNYISSSTANGNDPLSGGVITGWKWWNFAFPTVVTSNVTDTSEVQAISDFASATNGSVNFGGSVGPLSAYGESYAIWGDPANQTGWSASWAILIPSPVPLGSIQIGYSAGSFTMVAPPVTGSTPVTVDVSTTAGSATLLYSVSRSSTGIVTIGPGSTSGLTASTLVKIVGVPEANGHLKAYAILYYTGAVLPVAVTP